MAVKNSTLTFGLVSVPVGLDKVADDNEIKLDRASAAGNPVKRQEIDAVTGEILEGKDAFARGVWEDPKNKVGFHEIAAEVVAEIDAATDIEAFEIEKFIPLSEVPFERAVGCYFVKAQKGVAAKPLRLLYEGLRKTKRAGIFKLVLKTRQQPAVVYAKNGGLYVNTLVWAEDFTSGVKRAEDALASADVDTKAVELAVSLIEQLSGDVTDLDALSDDIRPLRAALIEDALKGKKIAAPKKAAAPTPASDGLMDQLEASILANAGTKGKKASSKAAAKVAA
jgi:DNA end-binding protein Ku